MRRLLFLSVFLLMSCGASPTVAVVPTTEIPATPTVIQCSVEAAAFVAAVQPVASEWDDANKLAGSTPRVSLTSVIAQLQSIRRRVEQLPTAPCAQPAQAALGQAMDQTISAYLAFLGQSSDSVVQARFKQASVSMQEFQRQMTGITTGVLPPVPTPEPPATPTARPSYGMTAEEQQYADKLKGMFRKIGDHVLELDNVVIRHFDVSGVTTNIVDFEVTLGESLNLDKESMHSAKQAWGDAVVKEVSKRYPKGPLTVELTQTYDSFTYLRDSDCFLSGDTLLSTGYSHTQYFFDYHRDEDGKATTRCY